MKWPREIDITEEYLLTLNNKKNAYPVCICEYSHQNTPNVCI